MKFKIMSLVVVAALIISSCGTTRTSTTDNAAYNVDVPQNIRYDFIASYPDAVNVVWNKYDANTVPIDWELTDWTVLDATDYVVTFDQGGTKWYGWYDQDGNLVGTAYAVTDFSRLPYAVNTMLKDKYKDYTIESVQREMKKSQIAYEIHMTSADKKIKLLVDANGNILKEKMK